MRWQDRFLVHDEVSGETYDWGQTNYVELQPWRTVAHILRLDRLGVATPAIAPIGAHGQP
jgi:starch synthase (maltosyl-transferring)